jgi:hypothetical protein
MAASKRKERCSQPNWQEWLRAPPGEALEQREAAFVIYRDKGARRSLTRRNGSRWPLTGPPG